MYLRVRGTGIALVRWWLSLSLSPSVALSRLRPCETLLPPTHSQSPSPLPRGSSSWLRSPLTDIPHAVWPGGLFVLIIALLYRIFESVLQYRGSGTTGLFYSEAGERAWLGMRGSGILVGLDILTTSAFSCEVSCTSYTLFVYFYYHAIYFLLFSPRSSR